jgi:hypothetical protein
MKKLHLILVLAFFGNMAVALAQPTAREVTPVTPAEYFQTRLVRLSDAIENTDAGKMVAYQRDLVGAMREYIIDVEKAGKDADAPKITRMTTIFHAFDGFSFHSAGQADINAKMALMEEFLGLMQN